MTLNDLCPIAAERFPDFKSDRLKGKEYGLEFSTNEGKFVIKRAAVKGCNTVAELRTYVASLEAQP